MVKRGKGIYPIYLVEWATEKGSPSRIEEVNTCTIKEAKNRIRAGHKKVVIRSVKRIK